jgi:class 3 adenylate cyclase/ABC-type transport system substrate-binding protein
MDAERRVVTVLMADLVGSTGIAERLGPERAKFLLDEVVTVMTSEIERLGGTVAQLAGDGMLALFGAPVAHEDDPMRAVRAALAIRSALERYAAEVRAGYEVDVAVRQALNTGVVVVSSTGSGDNRYNALGDTVNVAARLQELADGGDILFGDETARLVGDAFDLEPLGEPALRGRELPVACYRLLGEAPDVCEAAPPPLVGREYELSVLTRVMTDLAEGLGAIVVVTGEPGIGKSRLVAEAVRELPEDVTVLEGHGVSYASGYPLWPVRDLLRGWLGAAPGAGEAQLRLDLKARLASLPGDGDDPFPFVARVLGIRTDPDAASLPRELSGDALRRQMFEAIEQLLVRISHDRPICLVLEDLHWADDQTFELLRRLYELTEREAIALVMLYRSEREAPSWAAGERARQRYPHRYREVELRPLADDAARRLAQQAAGGSLSDEAVAAVADRAGGNPFFIAEAVRDLVERGADGDGAVPGAVQGALQARFDRLSPDARAVLNVAAVIGRAFTQPLLDRVAGASAPVEAALSELQRSELIVERRRRPAPEFVFRHGLVQEVAYSSLLEGRRAQLHREVAEGLEDLLRETGLVPLPVLAHHWSAADCPREAADYLIRAGDEARRVYASEDAVAFYRRARSFLARTDDERRSRETLFKIALVHHLAFRFAEAESAYDEAFCCRDEMEELPTPTETLTMPFKGPVVHPPGYTYTTESNSITLLVYRGLLEVDRDLNVMPSIADNFRVSGDGLTYMFRIREGAVWSDGVPVTAHDFAFTWRRMRDLPVTTAFLLDDIVRADALDDRTLEVELAEPRSYFLHLLAATPLFPWPRHLVERYGDDWLLPENLVGNGPYEVASVDENGLTLTASTTWTGRRGNVAEVRFEADPAEDEASRWRSGCYDIVQTGHCEPDEMPGALHASVPSLGTMVLRLRPEAGLADPLVRRAIVRHLAGRVTSLPAADRAAGEGGLLPPTMPGHRRRIWETADDPASMLARAGHPGGAGLPVHRLVVHERLADLGEEIAGHLATIGLRVEVAIEERDCEQADGPLWLSSWVADYPDPDGFFRGLVRPGGSVDLPSDDELNDLLARARSCRDRDERLELYSTIDRLLVTDRALLAPISYKRAVVFRRPWVHNLWANPLMPALVSEAVVDAQAKAEATAARSAAGTA